METVANFFGGNPFATPIGQKIERATDASLSDEDWGLNMEICDMINESEDGPKDAVRAMKRRLQMNAGKNHSIVMHTLIVLETCVKNCGRRFHVLVCTKDFVNELVKLIGPKNDPPIELQEKVLTLIQTWSDAFQQQPELQGVTQVYHELKSKGIEFPMTNLDTMAPIITPHRTHAPPERNVSAPRSSVDHLPTPASAPEVIPGLFLPEDQPVLLDASQMGKLHSDLTDVEGNMSVFSEMLAALVPGQEQADDLDLLRELNSTCQEMQRRIVELLDKVANDEVTAHLLKVNDDLNNIFLRYDRYEKNRQAATANMPNNTGAPSRVSARPPQSPSLIDLGDNQQLSASATAATVPLITTNMQSMGIRGGDEKEFDMFAQSRNATYDSTKQTPSFAYSDPDQLNASLGVVTQQRQQEGGVLGAEDILQGVKEEEIAEMEKWLGRRPGDEEATLTPAMKEYLKKRSSGAKPSNTSDPDSQGSSRRGDDSSLFSL